MPEPPAEHDRPAWDLRLVQWMSRDSAEAQQDSNAALYVGGFHGLIAVLMAAIVGSTYWIALTFAYLAAMVIGHKLRRMRRARSDRESYPPPTPFGR